MKIFIICTTILFFLTCDNKKSQSKTDNITIEKKTNVLSRENDSENFEDKIGTLMQKLNLGESPDDYENNINSLKDSINFYRNNLILDLRKIVKNDEQISSIINSLELNEQHFNENLKYESDIVSKSYGNSSYGFNSPRFQYTNGYVLYSYWNHLFFLKSMDTQIRENIIDYKE